VRAALRTGVCEASEPYEAGVRSPRGVPEFPEATLTALWLLGRVPAEALPLPMLRPGRAGRGPGPDVREAVLQLPSGVARAGDVEVHLRASDFRRHGHAEDPNYAGVILHLCWLDDRPEAGGEGGERGGPTPLPGGGEALTVELASALPRGLRDPAQIEALVARGPAAGIATPCAGLVERTGAEQAAAVLRDEGRKRLAERAWRAWRLADRYGFSEAFALLLDRALASTTGRVREDEARRAALAAAITVRLAAAGDGDALVGLEQLAMQAASREASGAPLAPSPGMVIEGLRVEGIGQARAAELGWNVALPLLSALAAAYDVVPLARAVAGLADRWPAPRPYGRTRSLAASIGRVPASTGGALAVQGLLHLQDLWCTRAGCGTCPASASVDAFVAFGAGGEGDGLDSD